MYHDAPMEVAMNTVHRRLRRTHDTQTGFFTSAAADSMQLQEILEFLLSPSQLQGPGAPMMRVALQFPDELLEDAPAVAQELEMRLQNDTRYSRLKERFMEAQKVQNGIVEGKEGTAAPGLNSVAAPSTVSTLTPLAATLPAPRPVSLKNHNSTQTLNPNSPTGVRFFILADSTFGSCCVDEITAQHYQSDLIVHFGDACMSRSTRLPVIYLHTPFRFHCIRRPAFLAPEIALAQDGKAPSDLRAISGHQADPAAVNLIVNVLDRVLRALRQNVREWDELRTQRGGLPSLAESPQMRAQLVVVGPHSVRNLLEAAERQWCSSEHDERGVSVVWCRFLNCDIRQIAESPHSDVDDAINGPAGDSTPRLLGSCELQEDMSSDSTEWIVNGVRFPRLPFHSQSEPANSRVAPFTVQYFLYVGPGNGPHLVHLLGVHQYNRFHYSEAEREFFLTEQSPTCDDKTRWLPPVLSVLDENFGLAAPPLSPAAYAKEVIDGQAGALNPGASPEAVDHFVDEVVRTASNDSSLRALLWTSVCTAAEKQFQRRQRQRDFNIEVVRTSSAVGILVASLAIAGYYELTMLLHKLLRLCGKRAYIIYVGHLNEFKLANFESTVDSFVVVACPNSRSCHFPERDDNYLKPVVSPAEVLIALTAHDPLSPQYGLPAAFSTAFDCVLPPLRAAVAEELKQRESEKCDDSGIKGRRDWAESAALVRVAGNETLTAGVSSHAAHGALQRLHERAFVGLDPCLGKTAVQTSLEEGKYGIARGYQTERAQQNLNSTNVLDDKREI